ncbi:MAG: insulinase family protein, partial [Dehalococcoidales bacterium]|nr:insulinase family protein [Dehalococcoidales bacterium]
MSTPVFQKLTLDGGLRLITAPMPHSRSVAISLFIGTGSRYEEENEAGISHFIEHMLFKGTAKRPTPVDICLPIEGTGGVINAATDKELTIYWCKVPQPHFAEALDVIADIVLSSKFDPGEIEKERQVIIEEINMSLDSPAQRVSMLIDEIMWPDHALGRDVAGTKQSVAAISREMMLSYLGRHYQPHNAVLAVAGGIRHEEVEETARRVFRGWENTAPGVRFSPYRPKNGRQVLVERRPTEQTHLCLALPGNSISDPDRFRLDPVSYTHL